MRAYQSGTISAEYVLSLAACLLIVVLGSGHERGVQDLFLESFRRIYADYTAMLGTMDETP